MNKETSKFLCSAKQYLEVFTRPVLKNQALLGGKYDKPD